MKNMTYKQFESLKKQIEKRYQEEIKFAEEQRIRRLKALEILLGTLSTIISSRSQYGSLTSAVTRALKLVPERFTRKHIEQAIHQTPNSIIYSPSSLSNCLKRLTKKDIIKETKKGRGRILSEYYYSKELKDE